MKLSVFVVTYNQEKYIRQCLDSILMQKVDFGYEVVIGEDHSTDGTRAICEEYAAKYPQVRLLPLTENLGVAGNWERVISECKGEYVAMCEGDDYWTNCDKLKKQVYLLESNYSLSGCYHNASSVDEQGNIKQKEITNSKIQEIKFEDSILSWYVPTASLVFRNSCYIKENLHLLYKYSYVSTDRLLIALIAHQGNIKYIDEIMSCYRVHDSAVTAQKNKIEMFQKTIFLFEKMHVFFGCEYDTLFRNAIQKWRGILAKTYWMQQSYFSYIKICIKNLGSIRSLIEAKTIIKNYILFRNI